MKESIPRTFDAQEEHIALKIKEFQSKVSIDLFECQTLYANLDNQSV